MRLILVLPALGLLPLTFEAPRNRALTVIGLRPSLQDILYEADGDWRGGEYRPIEMNDADRLRARLFRRAEALVQQLKGFGCSPHSFGAGASQCRCRTLPTGYSRPCGP